VTRVVNAERFITTDTGDEFTHTNGWKIWKNNTTHAITITSMDDTIHYDETFSTADFSNGTALRNALQAAYDDSMLLMAHYKRENERRVNDDIEQAPKQAGGIQNLVNEDAL
jgi:hypothetical protein